VTTPEIAAALATRLHFNTFGGNPVCCAGGREVLRVIDDEGIQANAHAVRAPPRTRCAPPAHAVRAPCARVAAAAGRRTCAALRVRRVRCALQRCMRRLARAAVVAQTREAGLCALRQRVSFSARAAVHTYGGTHHASLPKAYAGLRGASQQTGAWRRKR